MVKKIRVARKGNVLKPAKTEDLNLMKKIPEGEMFIVRYERIRNPKLHRKYFAVIEEVFQNQEFFQDKEHLRKFLEIAAGHYKVAYMPKFKTGEIKELIWPASISYSQMDEDEFQELYDKVLDQVEKNFDIPRDLLENEVKHE